MHSRLHSMFTVLINLGGLSTCACMVVQAVLCMPSPRNVLLHKLKLRMRRSLDIKIAEVPTLKNRNIGLWFDFWSNEYFVQHGQPDVTRNQRTSNIDASARKDNIIFTITITSLKIRTFGSVFDSWLEYQTVRNKSHFNYQNSWIACYSDTV